MRRDDGHEFGCTPQVEDDAPRITVSCIEVDRDSFPVLLNAPQLNGRNAMFQIVEAGKCREWKEGCYPKFGIGQRN